MAWATLKEDETKLQNRILFQKSLNSEGSLAIPNQCCKLSKAFPKLRETLKYASQDKSIIKPSITYMSIFSMQKLRLEWLRSHLFRVTQALFYYTCNNFPLLFSLSGFNERSPDVGDRSLIRYKPWICKLLLDWKLFFERLFITKHE